MQRSTPQFIEVWALFYRPRFREGLTMPEPERHLCDSTPAEVVIPIEIGLI
jgi:hypothetical protein